MFPASQFPLDVKRLRIGCLQRSGKPRDALREAGELRRDDGSTSTLVSFTRLCAAYGDLQTAIGAASELAERSDLLAEDAISVAELLIAHAPQLSRRLLRGAVVDNLPEGRIVSALSIGQRLAIDNEQAELRQRLTTMAGQAGSTVKALKEDDIRPLLARAQEACNEILALYEKGLIPVHTTIDRCGFNVGALLAPKDSQPFRPFQQPRFFVLHGKRSDHPPSAAPTVTRLNMDLTTVFRLIVSIRGTPSVSFPRDPLL